MIELLWRLVFASIATAITGATTPITGAQGLILFWVNFLAYDLILKKIRGEK